MSKYKVTGYAVERIPGYGVNVDSEIIATVPTFALARIVAVHDAAAYYEDALGHEDALRNVDAEMETETGHDNRMPDTDRVLRYGDDLCHVVKEIRTLVVTPADEGAAAAALDDRDREAYRQAYRQAARVLTTEHNVEVDDDAPVAFFSNGDGAWVQATVHVRRSQADVVRLPVMRSELA